MAKKTLSVDEVPEVRKFMEAQQKLQRIKEAYPEASAAFAQVADEYNSSLQAAEKAVKAVACSCGPFQVISTAEAFDADMLYELLGQEVFLAIGGKMKTVRVVEIDKDRVNAALVNGKIDTNIADSARKLTTRFKRLAKVEIP